MVEKNMNPYEGQKESMYEFFRKEGYLIIPSILTEEEADGLKIDAWNEYKRRLKDLKAAESFESASFKLYQAAQTIDSVLATARSRKLLDALEIFLGPNIILSLNRHNHISSGRPGENKDNWHRDYGEWSRGLLTAVIYCDNATEENGCTEILPQSHLWYSPGHDINDGYFLDDPVFASYNRDVLQPKQVSVSKGGMLVFDGMLFHRGGINHTDESRFAVVLGYHSYDQLDYRDLDENRCLLVRGSNDYRGNDIK